MSKDPDNQDEEFSFEDYEETEDEGLDLPDIEDELSELEEEKKEEEEEPKPSEEKTSEEEEKEEPAPLDVEPALSQAPPPEEISRDQVSVPLTIEIGRVNLSLEKLLQLKEGNVLDLSIQPESGVDLTVNGQCIGKGELLKVGDSIAIRILDLA